MNEIKKILEKQHYRIVGEHSAVQICRWTKKSLRNEGVCYKEKFYGISSHRCCQMTPSVIFCDNQCLHCWRAIELTKGNKINGKINSPSEIIDGCIQVQRKLLQGFKRLDNSKKRQLSKADMKKYSEAQEPNQFAISLSGEPTIYPKIGELIEELRKRKKTSFLVSNGLHPEKIKELYEKNQLPTQLYFSVNITFEKNYQNFHRSLIKNAWEKLNESLSLIKKINKKTRTVFRINLVKEINMSDEDIVGFAEMIKKYNPLFTEVKGYMSIGFARKRLGYEKMPSENEMENFCEKLVKELGEDFEILNSHYLSRAYLIGNKTNKKRMKIKEGEI